MLDFSAYIKTNSIKSTIAALKSQQYLDAMVVDLQEAIDHSVESQSDPSGKRWAAPAHPQPHPLLQKTGKGRRSIVILIQGSSITVRVGRGYMRFHQRGTKRMPQRRFLPNKRDLSSAGLVGRKLRATFRKTIGGN